VNNLLGAAPHILVVRLTGGNADAQDIRYKMGQKVIAHGGTISKTYVGYRNIQEVFEGGGTCQPY